MGSSHQVAKVLELQLQSFQRMFRVDFLLGSTGFISLQSKGLSLKKKKQTKLLSKIVTTTIIVPTDPDLGGVWESSAPLPRFPAEHATTANNT